MLPDDYSPVIIPYQESQPGDVITHDGKSYEVSQHYAQGKDMKGLNFSHIMFSDKGAFGLKVVE